MSKKQKYYVIWAGHKTGIFDSWAETEQNIKGFQNAQFKSFDTKEQAFHASKKNYWASIKSKSEPLKIKKITCESVIKLSISVDAACAGNPGILEYRGVNTETKEVLFFRGPFPLGTVNIGEFLAIVHGLAYLKKNNCPYPIYSDSRTAISWVKKKAIKTNLERSSSTEELFKMVDSALEWLHKNSYATKILKWETEDWGENPADYGRK